MAKSLFILGRTPRLAFLELQTFFPDVSLLREDIAVSATDLPILAEEVMARLGGTVKIAKVLGHVSSISPQTLRPFIENGMTFGVSVYGAAKISRHVLEDMKKTISGGRFIEAKGNELTSVVVEKNNVQEILAVKTNEGYVIGRTLAVQPFESWNTRDFGRPFADPASGMLPPKVSRMIVNIADQKRDVRQPLAQKTLLDPFCGMGTVLSEALVMGWNVVGSDQSKDVVAAARGNLRWLTEKHLSAEGVTYRLHVSDAVHVSDMVDANSIDAIVTEPFMGPAKIKNAKNAIKGLEKLYIGCLKDWHNVLKEHGMVVIALPKYAVNGKTYFVKKVIDMCENLGYTIEAGPIEYGRPGAVVKRMFFLFRKEIWHM